MKKILFICYTLVILFTIALSAQSCGVAEVFECPDGYTCCQGPTGRICHNVKEGVCCEDLLTCCGADSTCDNINHRCIKSGAKDFKLSFLSEN